MEENNVFFDLRKKLAENGIDLIDISIISGDEEDEKRSVKRCIGKSFKFYQQV